MLGGFTNKRNSGHRGLVIPLVFLSALSVLFATRWNYNMAYKIASNHASKREGNCDSSLTESERAEWHRKISDSTDKPGLSQLRKYIKDCEAENPFSRYFPR